jgi:hypothetical protein
MLPRSNGLRPPIDGNDTGCGFAEIRLLRTSLVGGFRQRTASVVPKSAEIQGF